MVCSVIGFLEKTTIATSGGTIDVGAAATIHLCAYRRSSASSMRSHKVMRTQNLLMVYQ